MDEVTEGAVAAVWHSDETEAKHWFDRLNEECRALVAAGGSDGWDTLKETLRAWADDSAFPNETVEGFTRYVEENTSSPADVIAGLAEPDADELLRVYNEKLDEAYAEHEAADEAASDETAFDEAAWHDYLTQWNGWWDGTEARWPEFRQSFVDHAPAEVAAGVTTFVEHVESATDKSAAMADYGLTLAVPPDLAAPSLADADELQAVETPADQAFLNDVLLPALDDIPELADFTEEELTELLDEVISELAQQEEQSA